MENREILHLVQEGKLSVEEALEELNENSYENLGYAKLDFHRKKRKGFGEVIFCKGKSKEELLGIYKAFQEKKCNVLGTQASKEQYDFLKEEIQNLEYNERSKVLKSVITPVEKKGCVVIATGGTSDIPVAEECAETAEFLGSHVIRLYDVGVAGIHRLLDNLEILKKANVIVAVAGMEGALASVIGGLVSVPVIALPTSVGYGSHFGGLTPLLGMLNSCSEGVTVVNIDNGFGAGYSAAQINQLILRGGKE